MTTDEAFLEPLNNIRNTDVLMIEEISMVSERTIGMVDYLCREIRAKKQTFGGIQVILTGDFFQLSPVPDPLYQDTGHYAFMCAVIQNIHHVHLSEVLRQADGNFVNVVRQISTGYSTN